MDEGQVAELIGKTLQWALNQVEGIPAILEVEARDIGEIDVRLLEGDCFRLSVSRIGEMGA